MSFALGHFSLGASIALIIFLILDHHYKQIKPIHFLKYAYPLAFFSGLWAMLPDFGKLSASNLFHPCLTQAEYNFCNLFFFHCILDRLDPYDTVIGTSILFGIFLVVVVVSVLVYRSYKK